MLHFRTRLSASPESEMSAREHLSPIVSNTVLLSQVHVSTSVQLYRSIERKGQAKAAATIGATLH